LALRKFSFVVGVFGPIALTSVAAVSPASAQETSGPVPDARPATVSQLQRTARTSQTGTAEVGQRLERSDVLNREPMQRINSRIENRVENRINNRIDRDQDAYTGSTAAYRIATARTRKTTEPLRIDSQAQ
jgi:hypothetical protein